jgi:hypothetical protein
MPSIQSMCTLRKLRQGGEVLKNKEYQNGPSTRADHSESTQKIDEDHSESTQKSTRTTQNSSGPEPIPK